MTTSEQQRFDCLYAQHLLGLKLHGYSASTIDVYSRAVRRISNHFDCVPDQLNTEQLTGYFAELVDSHSWATVRVDRNGLQFFWKHVLKLDWQWVKIIKPPKVRSLPDVLTVREVERLIAAARKLRYRVFVLTTYSMGLRLSETLSLQLSDIDAERKREKLLPVEYFLVTFTLPAELRPLAWSHQRTIYAALFAAASETLKAFGLNPKHLGADIGMTAILQTDSRRLTYHPHLHVILQVPVEPRRKIEKPSFRCSACGEPMINVKEMRLPDIRRQSLAMSREPPPAASRWTAGTALSPSVS